MKEFKVKYEDTKEGPRAVATVVFDDGKSESKEFPAYKSPADIYGSPEVARMEKLHYARKGQEEQEAEAKKSTSKPKSK